MRGSPSGWCSGGPKGRPRPGLFQPLRRLRASCGPRTLGGPASASPSGGVFAVRPDACVAGRRVLVQGFARKRGPGGRGPCLRGRSLLALAAVITGCQRRGCPAVFGVAAVELLSAPFPGQPWLLAAEAAACLPTMSWPTSPGLWWGSKEKPQGVGPNE